MGVSVENISRSRSQFQSLQLSLKQNLGSLKPPVDDLFCDPNGVAVAESTLCLRMRSRALAQSKVVSDMWVPDCDESGEFKPEQTSWASKWCVDPLGRLEKDIPRHRPNEKIDCGKYLGVIMQSLPAPPRNVRSGGRAVERRTVNRGDGGSIPPTTLGNFVTPHLLVSFGRELKAGGPFCLVAMPGEVKDPTQGVNV